MELKGKKVRLYPDQEQIQHLKQEVGNQRFVWNYFLDVNMRKYYEEEKFVFYNDMASMLKDLKQENDFLKLGDSQSLQQTLKDLEQSLKNCYKFGYGFPKFKKYNISNSYRVPQHFEVTKNHIYISKLGWIRFRGSKLNKKDKVKHITISKSNDKWYASLCIEFVPKPKKKTNKSTGLDPGSVRAFTVSDGEYLKAFRDLKRVKPILTGIKEIQRKMSHKFECWKTRTGRTKLKKGEVPSNKWLKLKKQLAKLHEKVTNIRKDFLHKASNYLIEEYDTIIVEDFKPKDKTRNSSGTIENPGKNVKAKSGLNKNLLSNGIGYLYQYLEYKCKWYGKKFLKVNGKYTSQICSKCGSRHKKSRESQFKFLCKNCNFNINADKNAARNIRRKGLKLLES